MADPVSESRVNRLRAGDRVELAFHDFTHEGAHASGVVCGDVGTVTGFSNPECTYVLVDFDGGSLEFTEDELRRLPPTA